ncbi:hypothetical protein GCM10010468_39020 [Actinocorallia longicatena]|uniref:Peptidase inhibitor family I36 n=1 Tax=Actinocorallia longicatena TaxID=111803 RepID=A0ABP6QAZ3_9ACTN
MGATVSGCGNSTYFVTLFRSRTGPDQVLDNSTYFYDGGGSVAYWAPCSGTGKYYGSLSTWNGWISSHITDGPTVSVSC